MNFTNTLLVFLLATHLTPGTLRTGLEFLGVAMLAGVVLRRLWGGVASYHGVDRRRF